MIPLNPFNRDLVIITITDGQPTSGYEPCSLAPQFLATSPISIVVGVGQNLYENLDQVSCIASNPFYAFWINELSDLGSILGTFEATLCAESTPYDGFYARFNHDLPGAQYLHWESDYVLQYGTVQTVSGGNAVATFGDEQLTFSGWSDNTWNSWGFRSSTAEAADYWFILDKNGNYLARDKPDNQCYPPTVGNWTYYNVSAGQSVTFEMLSYCFNVTNAPTHTPTATPSRTPSHTPTIIPSNIPSQTPTANPTPLSKPPTESPTPAPTDFPSPFPTPDCPNICVNGSHCDYPGGADFMFVVDSSEQLPVDQNVIDFFVNVVLDIIPHPQGDPFGQLGLIQYTDEMFLKFPINGYNVRDDWIEHIRSMEDLSAEALGTNTLPPVREAYNQLTKNGHMRDKVMYLMTDGGSLTDLCGIASGFESWGMFVIVIVVGQISNLEKIRLECLASTANSFIQIQSTDELSEIDPWAITCPIATPFDGKYRRMDEMYADHYQYMSAYKNHLYFREETWVFEADWCEMNARGGADQVSAPDRQTWDSLCSDPPAPFEAAATYEYVRITCCGPMPTISPSLTPTGTPSKTPTKTPSFHPTTPGPTTTPSNPPSNTPTKAPTPTCENFLIYRNDSCWEYTRLMDIVIIVDSSSSIAPENYERMRDTLADGLQNFLPESANVALLQYNHGQHLEFGFDENLSQTEYRQRILEMEQLGGGTYTANAIQYSLNNLWTQSTRSSKLLMTITDGQTSEGQSSCNVLADVADQGIDVIMVAMGVSAQDQEIANQVLESQRDSDPCANAVNKVTIFADYIFDEEHIANMFEGTCQYGTPFDAGYSVSDADWALNGEAFPEYHSGDGSVVYHNGFTWSVKNDEYGEMTSLIEMTEYFPLDGYPPLIGYTWNMTWSSGVFTVYDRVIVECVNTATPTRVPSNRPSVDPTRSPSRTPSSNPSVSPTFLPSQSPVPAPSAAPTKRCSNIFLESCDSTPDVDVTFVVSADKFSADLPAIKDFMSEFISVGWIDGLRISIVLSGSSANELILYESNSTEVEIAINSLSMDHLPDKFAVTAGLDAAISLTARDTVLVVVTSPSSATDDDPCRDSLTYDDYIAREDVTGIVVAIGENATTTDLSCLSDGHYYQVAVEDGMRVTEEIVDEVVRAVCSYSPYNTPFDGYYKISDKDVNGYWTWYSAGPRFLIEFEGTWQVVSDDNGELVSQNMNDYRPQNNEAWVYTDEEGNEQIIPLVKLLCVDLQDTVAPTYMPSTAPFIPCQCPDQGPLSIGMTMAEYNMDYTSFTNNVLTLAIDVPIWYNLTGNGLIHSGGTHATHALNTSGSYYPGSKYWTVIEDYDRCVKTYIGEFTWEQLLLWNWGWIDFFNDNDRPRYRGVLDITLEDCYANITRRICWKLPWEIELETDITIKGNLVYGGRPPQVNDIVLTALCTSIVDN